MSEPADPEEIESDEPGTASEAEPAAEVVEENEFRNDVTQTLPERRSAPTRC